MGFLAGKSGRRREGEREDVGVEDLWLSIKMKRGESRDGG